MPEESPTQSPWRWIMVPLWTLFFIMGLFPEATFYSLRNAAGVVTQHAWVNSPAVLCFGMVAFIVWFAYTHCRARGDSPPLARSRSFSAGIYAAVAFAPVRLELAMDYANIIIPEYRWMLIATVAMKLLCALYLLGLLVRYHFIAGLEAFATLPVLLPSVRSEKQTDSSGKAPGDGPDSPAPPSSDAP